MDETLGPNPEEMGLGKETPKPTTIANVERISKNRNTMIKSRAEIKELVESPLVEACEEFYDKNIQTLESSANPTNVGTGRDAYLFIDFDSLSEENKRVAERVGRIIVSGDGIKGLDLTLPVTAQTPAEAVRNHFLEIAQKFSRQPMTWAPQYSLDEVKGFFMYGPDEEVDPQIFSDQFYYDAESETFYLSEEHYRKVKEG